MPKPTAAELDYLPLPEAVRPELRKLLNRQRGWHSYVHKQRIDLLRVTRAQWIKAALAFDIDIEAMVHEHYQRTGTRLRRRRDMDGTVAQRKNLAQWL